MSLLISAAESSNAVCADVVQRATEAPSVVVSGTHSKEAHPLSGVL